MISKKFNWRSVSVNRSKEFEPLVDNLVKNKIDSYGISVFSNIKDLMVFAAMVGFENNSYEQIDSTDKISISLDTYSTTGHDAYIYLLALQRDNTLDVLKDENLTKTVKIFEGYCHAGLKIIRDWLNDESSDEEKVKKLFDKIYSASVE